MYNTVYLQNHTDERGSLTILEVGEQIPFVPMRIYYLHKSNFNMERGHHAHRDLEQVMFVISGNCTVTLDNGSSRQDVLLSDTISGIHISSMIWREIKRFSSDCILAVLANNLYDEGDYIRDYNEFLKLKGLTS